MWEIRLPFFFLNLIQKEKDMIRKYTVKNYRAIANEYMDVARKRTTQKWCTFLVRNEKGEEVYLFLTHGKNHAPWRRIPSTR